MPNKFSSRGIVLDTSVLIEEPQILNYAENANIYIPIEVLEELDKLKTRHDNVGASARSANRILDEIRKQGNLIEGVFIEDNDTMIKVVNCSDMSILPSSFEPSNDNKIISCALYLSKQDDVILLSRDIALRVKCDAVGVKSDDYSKTGKASTDRYMGYLVIDVDQDEIDEFYSTGSVELFDLDLYPNEFVIMKTEGGSSAIGVSPAGGSIVKKLKHAGEKNFHVEKIRPRNKEQLFALELLINPAISLVSLCGIAGSGKTLLSIAAAMHMVHNGTYKKIIISRPAQSMSKDIGYLPGSKEEKIGPWLQPIFDNLKIIFSEKSNNYVEMMVNNGKIEMEALGYIRGRSIPDTIFIIDEAQNITHHEAKAVLTRMGENSKIVLIGDLEQIDSPNINEMSSGLASVIDLFKEFKGAGHVTLTKGERSELATFAAKVM